MNRSILALAMLAAPLLAHAQSAAPLAYQASSGQYQATVVTSGVTASGTPVTAAYRGPDGQWHATLVAVAVCSLDANGHPLLCPAGVTQAQANIANGYAALNASGQIAASVIPFGTTAATVATGAAAASALATANAAVPKSTAYASDGGFILPQITTANLLNKTCAAGNVGEVWFVTDSVAFQDVASGKPGSYVYQDTSSPTSPGGLAVCKNVGGAFEYVTVDNHAGQVAPR